jgi:transcriptional regulator with XRE-family HTH domain
MATFVRFGVRLAVHMFSLPRMGSLPGLDCWLHAELTRRGWSPADLVRASGLSKSMVSRLLSGERKGRDHDTQVALAQALGLSHAEFVAAVKGQRPPPRPERDTIWAIRHDPNLTPKQQDALIAVYESYWR